MSNSDTNMNFEQKLSDLEALVAKLETGELSLDESLKAYEEGVALTRECQSMLEKAQLRIEMASKQDPSSSDPDSSDS